MELQFRESKILTWAEKYNILQKGEERKEEKALIGLKSEIQRAGCLNKSQLRRVAHWKAPRSAGYADRNEEDYVKEVSAWSFRANDERSRIEVLTLLDGVSWPSASVILHLFHEQPYPILDFRALWSVGLDMPKQYSFSFWWPYVGFCRDVADRNGVDMRTLDRALWRFSKENQNA